MRSFVIGILLLLVVCSCKKESVSNDCQKLINGMSSNNNEDVKTAVTGFIRRLPSTIYTSDNLTRLVQSISGSCSIGAETICFDCIKTLPSESEIRLSYSSGTSQVQKTIDISYDTNNQMKFVNMHE
jgi:hypothetical protein